MLDTALETGLSGSGRLHDLFLSWEAMSPGDYTKAGAGLTIYWGWFESPFGPALVMGTDRGICGMGFAAEMGEAGAVQDLQRRASGMGGTVVIGGIYEQSDKDDDARVPAWGELPLLGWLFKNQQRVARRTELLVFITPRVIAELKPP